MPVVGDLFLLLFGFGGLDAEFVVLAVFGGGGDGRVEKQSEEKGDGKDS